MTEQERKQKGAAGKNQQEGESQLLEGNTQQVTQTAAALEAVEAEIDDILADFTSAEGQTQMIGNTTAAKRPLLRQTSSEDFIRGFRQQTGQ